MERNWELPSEVLKGKNGELIYILEVTPEIAEFMLESNIENNRKISQSTVDKYAREMESGSWKFNGESIKFSKSGKMIDGQHRLQACIKSGISFETLINEELSDDTFHNIDTGVSRKSKDIAKMAGITDSIIVTTAAGKVKYLIKSEGKLMSGRLSKIYWTPEEILTELSDYENDYTIWSKFAKSIHKLNSSMSVTSLIAFSIYVYRNNPDLENTIKDFLKEYGDIEPACQTVRNLRIVLNSTNPKKLIAPEKEGCLKEAWNGYVTGKKDLALRTMRYNKERDLRAKFITKP